MDKSQFMLIGVRKRQGFFTNFMHTLQHLDRADRKNKIPIVYWHGGLCSSPNNKYGGVKSENIWDYFFEPVSEYTISDIGLKAKDFRDPKRLDKKLAHFKVKLRAHYMHDYLSCPHWSNRAYPPDACLCNPSDEFRQEVNGIIKKYIMIRKDIRKKAKAFWFKHLKGKRVVGVHIRYSDEALSDQGKNAGKQFLSSVEAYVESDPDAYVFLATDSHEQLEGMKSRFGDRMVYQKDIERGRRGNPVHFRQGPVLKERSGGAKIAGEALIDMILLSKCNYMIRGFSNLSSAASFYNPFMPIEFSCKYS
jgi:hypothetical protein